jgi:hypothetical protein
MAVRLCPSTTARCIECSLLNGYVDRFSRETLEERLEETPSNARCFAQGSSLMC